MIQIIHKFPSELKELLELMNVGVGDIVERVPGDPPVPPSQKSPKPFTKRWKMRTRLNVVDPSVNDPRTSLSHNNKAVPISKDFTKLNDSDTLNDSERIHLDNIRKIQQMGPEQLIKEREEIFRTMNPSVLQSLLRRAELKESNLKTSGSTTPVVGTAAPPKGSMVEWDPSPDSPLKMASDIFNENARRENIKPIKIDEESSISANTNSTNDEIERNKCISNKEAVETTSVHFPESPEDLRHYFPNLAIETEKLAWMQPISEAEEGEYSSELVSVAPSELRFDFKGNLITPKQSRQIPTSAGLHHHGDAPSAAGYTLPELAHLCRSSHPAQRSIAIQTAGRVLHKIRLRKFAKSSDLQEGLDALVQTTRILDSLVEAADEKTKSLTVRTLATEALWLAKTSNTEKTKTKVSELKNM